MHTNRAWKIKGNGGKLHNLNSHRFFIDHQCASCGWSFEDIPDRSSIKTLDDYKVFWHKQIKEKHWKKKWNNQGVHQLFDNIKKGDFLWTRDSGEYFVAEITDDPKNLFYFDTSLEATDNDCSAQLKNIEWVKVGKEDSVPGSVSFYPGFGSLVRIDSHEETINQACPYTPTSLFSALCLKPSQNLMKKHKITNKMEFFHLIGYAAAEDLVALWLYDRFGYVTIPSTNKISTEKYEFALVDTSIDDSGKYINHKKIYIQVKNGNVNLNTNDYSSLLLENEEIWLISTLGTIDNKKSSSRIERLFRKSSNISIEKYDINELLNFVFDKNKQNILPTSITQWIPLFL